MKEALRYSAALLGELRTSLLRCGGGGSSRPRLPPAALPGPVVPLSTPINPPQWCCSPQKYYELYMQACDELRNLEVWRWGWVGVGVRVGGGKGAVVVMVSRVCGGAPCVWWYRGGGWAGYVGGGVVGRCHTWPALAPTFAHPPTHRCFSARSVARGAPTPTSTTSSNTRATSCRASTSSARVRAGDAPGPARCPPARPAPPPRR